METHHELSSYVFCEDTARIAQGLRQLLELEGMECVDQVSGNVPDVASGNCNVWRVAVIPGRQGWHLVLTAPEALLCETAPNGSIRFVALCDTLGVPGFLREADDAEDCVGTLGEVRLMADGKESYRIVGQLVDYDGEDESDECYEGHSDVTWRGYRIDHGEVDEKTSPWRVINAALPEDREQGSDRYEPDLQIAKTSLMYVERLCGRRLEKYWSDAAEAWRLLRNYLIFGEEVPVAGTITLTFRWPAFDRAWPKSVSPAEMQLPEFPYGDGTSIHIGDQVRVRDGSDGTVVNLLYSKSDASAWPRYAAVRIEGRVRMIKPNYINRQFVFNNMALVTAAGEPGTKPSVSHLEQLAKTQDEDAMVQLGFIYYVGDGQGDNPPSSCKWLARAAELGHPDACYQLAEHHRSEYGTVFTSDTIRTLAEVGYRNGSVEAAETLIDYTHGSARIDLLRQMADEGNEIAQFELARRLLEGDGLPKDPKEAARLFELSAAQGKVFAQLEIGKCYENGTGVAPDAARAAYWYGLAVDQGCSWAYPKLARLYAEGLGVEKDVARARTLYERAQAEGIPGALESLMALGSG